MKEIRHKNKYCLLLVTRSSRIVKTISMVTEIRKCLLWGKGLTEMSTNKLSGVNECSMFLFWVIVIQLYVLYYQNSTTEHLQSSALNINY